MKLFMILALSMSGLSFAQEKTELPAEKVEQLKSLRASIRTWAKTCEDGSMTDNECPFGDMTIFAGLLCLSGELNRCEDVKKSQNRETGEWFRAPGLVGRDRPNFHSTFSRDQSRGVLAYLIKTKDVEAATKWMGFIKGNDYKLCKKPKEGGWDACNTMPMWWLETTRVWDFLELPRDKKMRDWNFLVDGLYRPLEAKYQKDDYPIHLTASGIYLRQEVAKRSGEPDAQEKQMRKILNTLERRWPENPFINYLKHGPTEEAVDVVLKYCPMERPALIDGQQIGQWIWQRNINDPLFDHDPARTEKSWDYPGGHDCIFMINLLIGNQVEVATP